MGLVFHIVAAAAACVLIWVLLSDARATGRLAGAVVTVGFVVRAFMAQAMFWISYLRLPIARSLQIGDGFWFFGVDGKYYFDMSRQLSVSGWKPFLLMDTTFPSPVYMRVLGAFIILFGATTFAAILINLFSYLGTALIICRWGRNGTDISRPALVGLIALTFSPAGLLWASQPLKDTFVEFVTVLFIGSCVAWGLWQRREGMVPNYKPFVLFGAMAVSLYVLAGIRWYFAVIAWASSFVFFMLTAMTLPRRRALAFAMNVAGFALLSQTLVLAAGPYLPRPLYSLLRFQRPASAAARLPGALDHFAQATREGFDGTASSTMITVGDALQAKPWGHMGVAVSRHPLPKRVAGGFGAAYLPPEAEELKQRAGQIVVLPTSTAGRLIVGYIAMLVPHAIAQRLGLVRVGGGRGLWLFADLDTLVFDIVLCFAIYALVLWLRSRALIDPSLWQILIIGVTISVAIAYTVNNFGTLFRHRDMVYIALCLIPVAASRYWQPTASEPIELSSATATV